MRWERDLRREHRPLPEMRRRARWLQEKRKKKRKGGGCHEDRKNYIKSFTINGDNRLLCRRKKEKGNTGLPKRGPELMAAFQVSFGGGGWEKGNAVRWSNPLADLALLRKRKGGRKKKKKKRRGCEQPWGLIAPVNAPFDVAEEREKKKGVPARRSPTGVKCRFPFGGTERGKKEKRKGQGARISRVYSFFLAWGGGKEPPAFHVQTRLAQPKKRGREKRKGKAEVPRRAPSRFESRERKSGEEGGEKERHADSKVRELLSTTTSLPDAGREGGKKKGRKEKKRRMFRTIPSPSSEGEKGRREGRENGLLVIE